MVLYRTNVSPQILRAYCSMTKAAKLLMEALYDTYVVIRSNKKGRYGCRKVNSFYEVARCLFTTGTVIAAISIPCSFYNEQYHCYRSAKSANCC